MIFILGIKFENLTMSESEERIIEFLNSHSWHYLVTPNPEIIIAAHQDEELFYILNKSELSLADGFGLKLASLLTGRSLNRVSGSDITPRVLAYANENNIRVLIANRVDGLSSKKDIELALKEKYPKLEFLVVDMERNNGVDYDEKLKEINDFGPKLMFCTFGSPYQEKFVFHFSKKITSLRCSLPVGGSFDFITNKSRRAPLYFRKLGLEWFWRLVQQPKRWQRIYRAVFVFSFKVLTSYLKHFRYRPNVVGMLYKKIDGKLNVLLVEREDEVGHWQMPQGGTDGESLAVAGRRELNEELNTDNFEVKAVFKNLYKYNFPASKLEDKRLSFSYKFEYRGQKQSLMIAEFKGDDEEIRTNHWEHNAFKWVPKDELVTSIHSRRQKAAKIYLEKLNSIID